MDFRIELAKHVAALHGDVAPQVPVTAKDTIEESTSKVFGSTVEVLKDTLAGLPAGSIEQAALTLSTANRIDVYGLGASALVAADAQHKLFRITSVASAYQDSHMQLMAAATLNSGDTVLAISHSGSTRELLDIVKIAREAGATIVAITRPDSPLARAADITVGVTAEETTALFTPMTSRLAHLVVVDALCVALALLLPPARSDRLYRMTRAISTRRVQDEKKSKNGFSREPGSGDQLG